MWADRRQEGVRSDECLRLAKLQSSAVDFAKTGLPAELPGCAAWVGAGWVRISAAEGPHPLLTSAPHRDLRHTDWPHWMRKKDKPMYTSETARRPAQRLP